MYYDLQVNIAKRKRVKLARLELRYTPKIVIPSGSIDFLDSLIAMIARIARIARNRAIAAIHICFSYCSSMVTDVDME